MANYKINRISEDMARVMADILRGIKDPRIGGMLSVTGAEVTPDLKFAKVYFSLLGGDLKETEKGLKSASGFIRREIARRMNLRNTPEITFVHDGSLEYGAKISSILHDIQKDGGPHDGA